MDLRFSARVVVGVSAIAVGCAFDSVTAADSEESSLGTGEGSTGGSTDAMPSTTGSRGDTTVNDDSGESSGSNDTTDTGIDGRAGAVVTIDDHDFGVLAPGAADRAMVSVSNEGDVAATDIASSALTSPFAFVDGAYPGTGGTCGGAIEAGQTCTIAVAFAPPVFGAWDIELVLTYAGGDEAEAHAAMAGASAGTTENLLVNGDAEAGGDPPMGWTNIIGTWTTREDGLMAHAGTRSINGGPFPEMATAQLRQAVPLVGYEKIVDAGQLGYSFAGFARSFGANDDPYQIRLEFFDGDGAELGYYDSMARSEIAYESLTDTNMLPAGTRTIAVDLFCHKLTGGNCSAFFDDLSLTLSYVAP